MILSEFWKFVIRRPRAELVMLFLSLQLDYIVYLKILLITVIFVNYDTNNCMGFETSLQADERSQLHDINSHKKMFLTWSNTLIWF